MKTTSHQKVCADQSLEFVEIVRESRKLADNEYFATMVTDWNGEKNPHVLGVDFITHQYLIGIERPNKKMGSYLSKNFWSRNSAHRGNTIIVKTDHPENFTILP